MQIQFLKAICGVLPSIECLLLLNVTKPFARWQLLAVSLTTSVSDLPLAISWSYHVIVAVGSKVGHSPWQVRWSGTCCLIISVIHRSASDLFDQHWRHSFSQCRLLGHAVEALCVRYKSTIIIIIIIITREAAWYIFRSCLSVCLSQTITFESLDVGSSS